MKPLRIELYDDGPEGVRAVEAEGAEPFYDAAVPDCPLKSKYADAVFVPENQLHAALALLREVREENFVAGLDIGRRIDALLAEHRA